MKKKEYIDNDYNGKTISRIVNNVHSETYEELIIEFTDEHSTIKTE